MAYEKDYKILSKRLEQRVVIESPFEETTREGLNLASVLLALTRNQFVVVVRKRLNLNPNIYYNKIDSQYALDDVDLSVFKRTQRQVLKACFNNKNVKYFELGICKKRKVFWELWCNHVRELKARNKKWPFQPLPIKEVHSINKTDTTNSISKSLSTSTADLPDEVLVNVNTKSNRKRWTDKYVYLGPKRQEEDSERPVPFEVQHPDGIKLFYMKSEHLGCWDQVEHWVQCESVGDSHRVESRVSTYTGQPTTKVTYTSIITAWK